MRAMKDLGPPKLGDSLELLQLIWTIDHRLRRGSRDMERKMDLTGPQRLAIRLVGRFPGISARRLSGMMQIDPSTLTGILKRLEAKGWVERRLDARDRRRARLGLTAEGRAIDANADGTLEEVVRRAMERAGEGDLAAGKRLLEVLAEELGNYAPPPRR